MNPFPPDSPTALTIQEFVRSGFTPAYGEKKAGGFGSDPKWRRLRQLGTELWLDTGDPDDVAALWTNEFKALTTNNTLLNQEVQKGTYDQLVPEAARLLQQLADLNPQQKRLELAFILNARHGLSLVEKFDARVSVEEHTDLAHDMSAAIEYGCRYHAICPERFYIKIPLTPAGILAARKLSGKGIQVNQTLGFSARQNYLAARLARPSFVNVFLGRLNSFVADNQLGDGLYVGERATLASQHRIRQLRTKYGLPTRQIGASLRDGRQVRDLAGLDVLTMPRKAAESFLGIDMVADDLVDCTDRDYRPGLKPELDPVKIGLPVLWDLSEQFVQAIEDLACEDLDSLLPDDLVGYLADRGFADLFPRWSDEQVAISAEEGKIPQLGNWQEALEKGEVGLDALMNLAAFNSFAADQKEMDERVFSGLTER